MLQVRIGDDELTVQLYLKQGNTPRRRKGAKGRGEGEDKGGGKAEGEGAGEGSRRRWGDPPPGLAAPCATHRSLASISASECARSSPSRTSISAILSASLGRPALRLRKSRYTSEQRFTAVERNTEDCGGVDGD